MTVSPSRCHWLGPREKKNQYNLGLVPLQKLPEGSAEHLSSGSTLDLSSRFTPEAFRRSGIAARQRRFEIRVYLPLDGLPSQAKSPIYPGQLVIRRQWLGLRLFSCRWCQFRRAEARRGTIVTVLLTSLSRSVCLVTNPRFFPLTYGQCASGLILKSAGKRPVSNFELGH